MKRIAIQSLIAGFLALLVLSPFMTACADGKTPERETGSFLTQLREMQYGQESETENADETKAEPETKSETQPKTEPETQPETEPKTEPETQPAAETTAAPVTEPAAESSATSANEAEYSYILNTNSKKFHFPDCASTKKMKEQNKSYFTGIRSDIIALGYMPCQNCNP